MTIRLALFLIASALLSGCAPTGGLLVSDDADDIGGNLFLETAGDLGPEHFARIAFMDFDRDAVVLDHIGDHHAGTHRCQQTRERIERLVLGPLLVFVLEFVFRGLELRIETERRPAGTALW